MNELLRRKAIAIMDSLLKHPSAMYFYDEPTLKLPGSDKCIDLKSIQTRLLENKYSTLQEWADDIENCWSYIEKENTDPTDLAQLSELSFISYDRYIFEKEKKSIGLLSTPKWISEIIRLRSKLTNLMSSPPTKVREIPQIQKYLNASSPPISQHELQCFVTATEKLQTKEDNKNISKIISEFQPELFDESPNLIFDVTKLNKQTFQALRTYVKAAIEKKGEKYPQ
ncbi:Bromodomain containing protein [Histomonas meleagridis]|uniref:Bromodomain containing protein n=1 Tax=Histomonas meleagridis TaxID=135588 RepID=UPI00355A9DD6|nr:Bromodomain containing protein [Histomonas meleagridis]KAH0805787.1 Bromodomain containing protein [Histomonas meleagridis]